MFNQVKFEESKNYLPLKETSKVADKITKDDDSEISCSSCVVDRYSFPIFKKIITSANILEVVAGTNGYHGGDGDSGSRTFIRIKDLGSTGLYVNKLGDYPDNAGVELVLAGDTELYTTIEALKFIIKTLEAQAEDTIENRDF